MLIRKLNPIALGAAGMVLIALAIAACSTGSPTSPSISPTEAALFATQPEPINTPAENESTLPTPYQLPGTQAAANTGPASVTAAATSAATSGANTQATPSEEAEDTNATSIAADIPKPSNGGGNGPAINLTGDATRGATIFAANCVACHAAEGKGGIANPGSTDGTVPPLNPIDPGLANPDPKVFAKNIDLFIEHGSTPDGTKPQISMIPFGDSKILTPQQIADVMAYVISLNANQAVAAPSITPTAAISATESSESKELADVPKPSNGGGNGPAINLTGDATRGATIFAANCVPCHAAEGKGGIANPGSTDGTVPPLNPIDPGLVNADPKIFAKNIDLFIEHGSTPEGTKPQISMIPFGDSKILTPQQIADVIAYVISLNPKK